MTTTRASTKTTYTADRAVIIGHCPSPDCGRVLAVFNNHRAWPPVLCLCGWAGDTRDLVNRVRLDHGWKVSDERGPERELRP